MVAAIDQVSNNLALYDEMMLPLSKLFAHLLCGMLL